MRVTYDPKRNIAYIAFGEANGEVESIRLSDDLVIDVRPDGSLRGIELLDANRQLEDGTLTVVDPGSGAERQVKIAG
jgi:uncharacterized protein YuzE